jgi:hypothetical protein
VKVNSMAEKTAALATVSQQPATIERSNAFSLAPRNFDEAQRFSKALAESDLAPKDFKGKPGNILIALQMGAEVGLAPMAAIQNIAVINGRPSIWGDAALAIVMAHRDYEFHKEYYEGTGENRMAVCEVKRKGHDLHTVRFSVADAKRSKLWGKEGPWSNYPDRMLQMRARGWAIRDKFADALRGLNIGEEMQDIQTIEAESAPMPSIDPAKETLRNEIDALLTAAAVNGANRMAILGANDADLAQCLDALKIIKYVLTSRGIPVQQWPALLQKHMRNLDAYAKELKAQHESKPANGNGDQPATDFPKESVEPQQGQQAPVEAARTGAANSSGDSRPVTGKEEPSLFVTEKETQPVAVGGKRFKF